MAKVTFSDGIASMWGAIDSAKEGQKNRRRLVIRRHNFGPKTINQNCERWHQLFYYHMHEGAWSDAATKNREMIKAAQRTAHDIERDPELRKEWEAKYAEYRRSLKPGESGYHFYNYIYVTIYKTARHEM